MKLVRIVLPHWTEVKGTAMNRKTATLSPTDNGKYENKARRPPKSTE
jgi:hypothetical protein